MTASSKGEPKLSLFMLLFSSSTNTVFSQVLGPMGVEMQAPYPKDCGHMIIVLVTIGNRPEVLNGVSSSLGSITGTTRVLPNPLVLVHNWEVSCLQWALPDLLVILAMFQNIYTGLVHIHIF